MAHCDGTVRPVTNDDLEAPEMLDYGTLPKVLPTQATMIFDGHCGFCTRIVGWLGAIDRHDRLEFAAAQQPGVLERFELTGEEADDSAWTIGPDGERVGGARAIALAVAVAIGNRAPYVPWHIPRGMWVMGKSYRFVANRRDKLPGTTPWCEQHPGQCRDPAA